MQRIKNKIYEAIFEADTKSGRFFDILLIVLIVFSIIIVMIESDDRILRDKEHWLTIAEWIVTLLFSIEYLLRIWVVDKPRKYIFSFFGIIDLLSILPTFIAFFFAGTHMLVVIRSLRLLRVFRVLKLTRYVKEASVLWSALSSGRNKIGVFLFAVVILIIILGTVMYIVESPFNDGFRSIPESIYWAVVTLTTVGYGDIVPVTTLGKFIAGFIMIIGYAIIAVPTGIVTSELAKEFRNPTPTNTQVCQSCLKEGHDDDARHCKHCGKCLSD